MGDVGAFLNPHGWNEVMADNASIKDTDFTSELAHNQFESDQKENVTRFRPYIAFDEVEEDWRFDISEEDRNMFVDL